MTAPVEVVVIGGGILGATVAHRLAGSGRSVIQFAPPKEPGAATVASGAMLGVLGEVTPSEDPWDLELRVRAAAAYDDWSMRGTVPTPTPGTFLIAGDARPSDLASADAVERAADVHGVACERVEPEDVPGLRPARGFRPARVLHLPKEGSVPIDSLLAALAATSASGTSTERVIAIEHTAGRVTGVRTASGAVSCGDVVLCAGAAVPNMLKTSGLDPLLVPPLVAAKGVGVVLEQALTTPLPHVLRTPSRDFACGLHLVPRGGRELYLGATNRASRVPQVLGHVTAGELSLLLVGAANELNEDLGGWNVTGTVWGLRALPADGRPIVGRTGMAGLSVATGTYRNGVLLGPMLADLLVEELDGGARDPRMTPRRPHITADAHAVLSSGIDDLAEILRRPDWEARLGPIVGVLARIAVDTTGEMEVLRNELREHLGHHGRTEMLPEALVELVQHWDAL